MIQTADYEAADYHTDYKKSIKSRCFDQKLPNIETFNIKKFTFFSHRAPKM